MSQFFRCIFVLGCFTAIGAFSNEIYERHDRVTLRHIERGGIGYQKGYTTLETFLAPDPSRWAVTPFLDARGHVFDDGKLAANAGIGLRGIWGKRVYGINGYYDYRNTHRFHYNQIGLGLETLGKIFDFRINGYLPVGKKISAPYDPLFARFSGHSLILSQKYQLALKGADAEFGFHCGGSRLFNFYAAAGPYYFIGEIGPNIWGGKARISGTYKDLLALELSDSYDRTFHNRFQGQISLNFSFGPKSKVERKGSIDTCPLAYTLTSRMVQPVEREEIIVIDKKRKDAAAIDPATGLPYFFIFVDNTSSSNGTYESPYPSFAQAEANSAPNQIIYVFPGNGTTAGMNAGISLKASQKFWGSGVSHSIQTSVGTISIPAQSSASPTITNTDVDTEGNAITLATHNAISGFHILSARNDAIYGADPQSLDISSCTIENTTTFAIQALFSSDASISLTNNQFVNNANGIVLTLNGTSTLVCSENTFEGMTSVSEPPLIVIAGTNPFSAHFENNVFNNNEIGSIRVILNATTDAQLTCVDNIFTANRTGSGGVSSGSTLYVTANGSAVGNCTARISGNTFSENEGNSVYFATGGTIATLDVFASENSFLNNQAGAVAFATSGNTFTLLAENNILSGLLDNGISTPATTIETATLTIRNNLITDIGGSQNGIAIAHAGTHLDLTVIDNEISHCEGSGVLYFSSQLTHMRTTITENAISNCLNASSNFGSGVSLSQYVNFTGTIADNTFADNTGGASVDIRTDRPSPTVCLHLEGNTYNIPADNTYQLLNPVDGTFNLSPCNVNDVNTGIINTTGAITSVQSCPDAVPCPP